MLNTQKIKDEIQERLGFVPSFFLPAEATPEILANLWQQTLSAYIENPLPALFKEKLFAYLGRYCQIPYSIICHSYALKTLGMTASEILALLQETIPNLTKDQDVSIKIFRSQLDTLINWPSANSELERSIYRASIIIFLSPTHGENYRRELKRILGTGYYNHLMAFLAYIKNCHHWIECFPEISYESDPQVKLYLAILIDESPELAGFFTSYSHQTEQEYKTEYQAINEEIIKRQQLENTQQKSEENYQNVKDIGRHKVVELALKDSNNILRAVVEGTKDAIFLKDIQGRYLMVNSTSATIFGKPAAEIIGKDDSELLPANEAVQIMENDRRIMASGQSQILEEMVTSNNIKGIYLSTKDIYRDSQGNVIGLIGVAREITDRKRLEQEREQLLEQLRKTNEDLAALNTVTVNAISTLNLEDLLNVLLQRIAEVLKADTAVFLLKEGDRLLVRATIGIDQEHLSGFEVLIGEGFAGTIAANEKPLYLKDAQTDLRGLNTMVKRLNIRSMLGIPLKRNGNLVGVLHVDWFNIHPYSDRELHLLEITGERCAIAILNAQLYEQTKQLQERLQLQIERMPIGCIIADCDFRFMDWNPAAEKIFGYRKEEVLGKLPYDLIIPRSALPYMKELLQRLATGDMTAHSANANITKDGRIIFCEWHNTPLKNANGKIIGYMSMVEDITERQLAKEALTESEKRYRLLFQSNPHPMWVYDLETLAFLDVNEAAIEHYGYSRDEFLAMKITDIRLPEDIPALLENISRVTSGVDRAGGWRHCKKDGSIIYVEITSHTLNFAGRPAEVVLAHDITQRKIAEDALKESEHRYYTLAKISPVAIFRTDAEGQCLYINDRWCQITGLSVEESLKQGWAKALHPDDREQVLNLWYHAVREKLPFQSEYRFVNPNGVINWVFAQATPEQGQNGQITGFVGTLTDITARKQAEEQLRRYAYYDRITGLPNRTLFLKQLEEIISLAKHDQTGLFAVLFLDINRFQTVKFSLGHHLADRLLISAASRIMRCLEINEFSFFDLESETSLTRAKKARITQKNLPKDSAYSQSTKNSNLGKKATVAQVGLDEFAILLTNLQEVSDATCIADQIYQQLTYPFNLNGQEVFVSTNIGIAASSIGYDQSEDFLRAADTAMHQSKKISRYAVFEPKWQTNAVECLQLEADLRRTIKNEDLQVYYQPIVALKNEQLIGFEALVRWQHPTKGWISPGEFIPLAEETGLISLIDRWVLKQACQQMVLWQQKYPSSESLTISVNLSGIQLAELGLIERIDRILLQTRINRKRLKLEITESSLLGNPSSETAIVQQLKNLGIQLSIDDFGTGYSSLARLHQLPINTLKIDRCFVNNMMGESESREIIRTIISLAHILDMDVIAEGVETSEQLAQLKALECEYSQGYFFSRPLHSQAAEEFIAKYHPPIQKIAI